METTEVETDEYDIGPPPRVILEDEEEIIIQNAKQHVMSDNSESNLDTNNGTRTHDQHEHNTFQNYPNSSPSGFDLRSLTSISGTKVSPGFSSFETFKPKPVQNRKQRCDSPIQRPPEHKPVTNAQKSLPASRLPKPKIYVTKTAQVKPALIRRSAQLNLSSLTSIKKEDEVNAEDDVNKPKKVPPPVPPRRSSLNTISKTSLEEYADKLGSAERPTKIEKLKFLNARSQAKITSSSTEQQAIPKCSYRPDISTGADHSSRRLSKGENCNKSSIRRGHTVERSAKPRIFSNQPSTNLVHKKTQMTKLASYESTEKNGQVVMTSASTELENVYKKITKFNWNTNEFSSHVNNPSPLSSTSCSSCGSNNVKVSDNASPHSSIISGSSTCSIEYDIHSAIANSQIT